MPSSPPSPSSHASIESICAYYKPKIEADLVRYTNGLSSPKPLVEAITYALSGNAKRLRPSFVRMMADALGAPGCADEVSLAVEFFHTASLIADDLPCMDNDTMRRGAYTVHVVHGESTALLASYALIAAGYEYITKSGLRLGKEKSPLALTALENVAYNTGITGATGGQWLDLFTQKPDLPLLKEIMYKKTVSLFEIAFVLGWVFGDGPLEQLPQVKQCALHFGYAFQIADDLQDMIQDKAHSSLNCALVLGKETARRQCLLEIEAFSRGLESLNAPLTSFKAIAHELALATCDS